MNDGYRKFRKVLLLGCVGFSNLHIFHRITLTFYCHWIIMYMTKNRCSVAMPIFGNCDNFAVV